METTINYLESIIGKCFHYRTPLTYPHGKMQSIRPYKIYNNVLLCMIAFPDGYIGDYAMNINDGLVRLFKSLKEY